MKHVNILTASLSNVKDIACQFLALGDDNANQPKMGWLRTDPISPFPSCADALCHGVDRLAVRPRRSRSCRRYLLPWCT